MPSGVEHLDVVEQVNEAIASEFRTDAFGR